MSFNFNITDIKKLPFPKEIEEDYKFSNFLNNVERINFFIGANNSGKSRFLRSLFEMNIENILTKNDADQISEDIRNDYEKEILSYIKNFKNSNYHSFSQYINENLHNPLSSMGKNDLFHHKILELDKTKTIETLLYSGKDETERDKNILIPAIQEINKKYLKIIKPLNPYLIEKLYIPVLRGLRPLIEKNEDSNCYLERTKKDYFKSNEIGEIATGLELYEDVKKHLLGYSDQREIIRKYEDFLSVNFFEKKSINLVPHIDSDVLHIKIGEEADFPIYNVGDGIQQLIILTYPLFKNKGKNMFVFMEEPELYLHPGLQRRFIEILKSDDFDTFKFFIATHSNNFLDMSLETEKNDTSIYTFEKITNYGSKVFFEIKNVASTDNNILNLIGARNSAMFMSNCSIWVEGITDRIYLKSYLKAYEINKKTKEPNYVEFKEDIHYSFFEYAGSNLSHYIFDDSDDFQEEKNKINGQFLSNKIFLIADKDKEKEAKHTEYEGMSRKSDKFKYYKLPVREIENLINKQILKEKLPELLPKLNKGAILEFNIEEADDFETEYLGKYLIGKFGKESLPESFSAKSGTLSTPYKTKLANLVAKSVTWENMSPQAQKLTEEIYEFIKKSNLQSNLR